MVITIHIMQNFGSMQLTVPFESSQQTIESIKKFVQTSHEFIGDPNRLFSKPEIKVDLLASRLDCKIELMKIENELNESGNDIEIHFVEDDNSFEELINMPVPN